LASTACTLNAATDYLIRFEIDGSALEASIDTSTCTVSASNTNITGNLRTGFRLRNGNGGDDAFLDDFEAGDLGAAPRRRAIFISMVTEATLPKSVAA
jgi:hypothetical protein